MKLGNLKVEGPVSRLHHKFHRRLRSAKTVRQSGPEFPTVSYGPHSPFTKIYACLSKDLRAAAILVLPPRGCHLEPIGPIKRSASPPALSVCDGSRHHYPVWNMLSVASLSDVCGLHALGAPGGPLRRLQSLVALISRTNLDGVTHRVDEYLAVPDVAGPGMLDDGVNGLLGALVVDHQLKLHLR